MATTSSSVLLSNPFSPPRPHHHRFTPKTQTHLTIRHHPTPNPTSILSCNSVLRCCSFRNSKFQLRTSMGDTAKKTSEDDDEDEALVVGEDSAFFDLARQKISSWLLFSLVLGVVLFVLDFAWIDNSGLGLGNAFIHAVSELSDSPEVSSLFFFCGFRLSFYAFPSICLLRTRRE